MFSPPSVFLSVCLSVYLFVCEQDNSKSYGPILMKFDSITDNDVGKNPLNFGHDPYNDSEKCFQFQEHNLLDMWPLNDATALGLVRTFARN